MCLSRRVLLAVSVRARAAEKDLSAVFFEDVKWIRFIRCFIRRNGLCFICESCPLLIFGVYKVNLSERTISFKTLNKSKEYKDRERRYLRDKRKKII